MTDNTELSRQQVLWGTTFHRHVTHGEIHSDGVSECTQPDRPMVVYVFDPDMLAAHDEQVRAEQRETDTQTAYAIGEELHQQHELEAAYGATLAGAEIVASTTRHNEQETTND